MILKYMTEEDAKEICDWEYSGEYCIYNIGGWETAIKNKWSITEFEARKEQFRTIYDDNQDILGYFRFKVESEKIILGLGMHPKKCGNGIGKQFIQFILNTEELKGKLIELEVRNFNKRAIKCYKSVGFQIIDKKEKETLKGKDIFIIMKYNNI